MFLLEPQLVIALETSAVEAAVLHRFDDGTSGFARVAAVPKPARLRERFDVREGAGQRLACVPQLQFAHPWRVDQDAAARKEDQLAPRAGMAPAAVALAHLARREHLLPDQRVRDRRLPNA